MKKMKKERKTRALPHNILPKPKDYKDYKKPNFYGLHAVREAWLNEERMVYALYMTHMARRHFDEIVLKAKTMGLRRPEPVLIDKVKLEKLLPNGAVHQGVALCCAPLEEMDVQDLIIRTHDKKRAVIALLDQVTDPHNVGAILRSASAFGLDGVLMQTKHAPALEGVLAKTACGAVDHIPVAYATNLSRALETLREAGFTALALDERGEREIGDVKAKGKLVLALGSEGSGLRPLIKDKCDILTRLPTQGVIASLNVSNAAAVAFFALNGRGQL